MEEPGDRFPRGRWLVSFPGVKGGAARQSGRGSGRSLGGAPSPPVRSPWRLCVSVWRLPRAWGPQGASWKDPVDEEVCPVAGGGGEGAYLVALKGRGAHQAPCSSEPLLDEICLSNDTCVEPQHPGRPGGGSRLPRQGGGGAHREGPGPGTPVPHGGHHECLQPGRTPHPTARKTQGPERGRGWLRHPHPTPHRKPGRPASESGGQPQPGALKSVFVPWDRAPCDGMLGPAAAVPLCWAPGRLKALFTAGRTPGAGVPLPAQTARHRWEAPKDPLRGPSCGDSGTRGMPGMTPSWLTSPHELRPQKGRPVWHTAPDNAACGR